MSTLIPTNNTTQKPSSPKRILFSWIAFNNDFSGGKITTTGPNYQFHQYHYKQYDKHIVLSASSAENPSQQSLIFLRDMQKLFPRHQFDLQYLNVSDIINHTLIESKVTPLLLKYRNDHIDILISPGTPAMQTVWFLCHINLGLKTQLLQLRPVIHSKADHADLLQINIEKSTLLSGTLIKQQLFSEQKHPYTQKLGDYFYTDSIKPIYDQAFQIAQAERSTVLIQGESGTGKEHLAHYIHLQSPRKDQPFIAINCGALPEDTLQSVLFGHAKGAFTGAIEQHKGYFLEANGGTIFLDEIGDISPKMQVLLLRTLENNDIQPVGGNMKKVDIRIIAGSNKNLFTLCESQKFRWDLYYRLAVIDLDLPSLQERGRVEIQQLIAYFIRLKQQQFRQEKPIQLSKVLWEILLSYRFPGNVRELQNLIERFYVLQPTGIIEKDLLPKRFAYQHTVKDSLKIADLEKQHIQKVLLLYKGNKKKTHKALGIAYNTLMKKVKDYGLYIP